MHAAPEATYRATGLLRCVSYPLSVRCLIREPCRRAKVHARRFECCIDYEPVQFGPNAPSRWFSKHISHGQHAGCRGEPMGWSAGCQQGSPTLGSLPPPVWRPALPAHYDCAWQHLTCVIAERLPFFLAGTSQRDGRRVRGGEVPWWGCPLSFPAKLAVSAAAGGGDSWQEHQSQHEHGG